MWTALKALAEKYPVKPMSSACTCGTPRHDATRPIVHDDGWHVTCLACGAEWVEFRLTGRSPGQAAVARP